MALFRRGNIWYIDYRAGYKRYREAVGTSRKMAEAALAKRKTQIAENRFLDAAKSRQTSFTTIAEAYMDWARMNKRSADRDDRSIRTLARWYGDKKLYQITPFSLERYKKERSQEVSRSTVNRELACLKHIFSKAVVWEMADDNPVKKVKLFGEPPGRVRFLSHEEIQRLLQASTPHLKPIIIVALLTGMRKGEILRLQWKDLDFERQLIHVRNSKNGEDRRVAMSHELQAILSGLPRVHQQVFTHPDGGPVLNIKTAFENAVRRAELADFSFHDLRHTFASYMMMNGAEILTVSRILGHKTLNMTLRYAHLSPSFQREAMERLKFDFGPKLDTRHKVTLELKPLTSISYNDCRSGGMADTRDLKSLGP